ncbi:MAG: efflux RND transporter periplasmic adaptor subunit [Opitutaceae bacterium]|nr:efflux RND transporter periplasmic adaptor subunit [Opitutaceae bacterium]
MKTNFNLFRVLTAAIVVLIAGAAFAASEQLWTCGMHPQVIKTEPGSCPICGMALTPIRDNAAGTAAGVIHVDTATVQRMNLKTGIVTRGPVEREIRAVGAVDYDERGLRDVTTKYEGWIERLHVDATWTTVKAGDPLFEIYSPDLYNAQLNYLVALGTGGGKDGPLGRAALARLRLFDIPDAFIEEIARTGEPRRTFTYLAPADGVVIEKMAIAGQMMRAGERIYRIADLSTVWVHAQVYESDLAFIREGMPATVRTTFGPATEIQAQISLLLPRVEETTRSATARLVLPNPDGALRPGMFVDVRIPARLADSAVLVPDIAVLRSGERNTVFIANPDGTFGAREVKLGARSKEGSYEVLDGLDVGDRIVTSGQFMLDSESQLREAIQKMVRVATAGAPAGDAGATPVHEVSGEALGTLTALSLRLADAAAVLAADDLAGYRRQLPALREVLKAHLDADPRSRDGTFAALKDGPTDPADLESAQNAFAPFSTAVADLARANHIHHREGLHLFECPMAPEVGTGRWLQRDAEIRNPFFGSGMLTCGEELDVVPAGGSTPAPVGHRH